MKTDEAKTLCKTASGLFGDLKPEGLKLLYEKLLRCDRNVALASLKTHRQNNEFFVWPKFLEGLRAEQERQNTRRKNSETQTIASWILQDPKHKGKKREDAIFDHFSACWTAVKDDRTALPGGKQAIRMMIHADCRKALYEIGWDEADAREWSDSVVEAQPGEKLTTRVAERGGEPLQLVAAAVGEAV